MVNNVCTRSVFNGKYGNGPLMTKIKKTKMTIIGWYKLVIIKII